MRSWFMSVKPPLLVVSFAVILPACAGDRLAPREDVFDAYGRPLNAATMQQLRERVDGCGLAVPDVSNGARVLRPRGNNSRLPIPTITAASRAKEARSITLRVTTKGMPEQLTISCWVPATLSVSEFLDVASGVDWKQVFGRIQRGYKVSAQALHSGMSPEVSHVRRELVSSTLTALPVLRGGKSGASRSTNPVCVITITAAAGPPPDGRSRANLTLGGCECTVTSVLDDSGEFSYWVGVCTGSGGSAEDQVRVEVEDTSNETDDMNALIWEVEVTHCGYSGCLDGGDWWAGGGGGGGGDVTLDLDEYHWGEMSDEWVLSQFQGTVTGADPISYAWEWTRDDPDDTQTPTADQCPTDTNTCQLQVYGSGRMDLYVQTTGGSVYDWVRVTRGPVLCSPGGDERDVIRAEYDTTALFTGTFKPRCADIRKDVATPNFGWPEIGRDLDHPAVGGVYLDRMLTGIEAFRALWGPTQLSSTYRCPRRNANKQGAPASRHMFGDAVDIDNINDEPTTWDSMFAAALQVPGATVLNGQKDPLCAVKCLHVDWR